jgi:hypothetical protein
MKKHTHGGVRVGSGRPTGEPTTTITFRVLVSVAKSVKKKFGRNLNKKFAGWLNDIDNE